MRTAVAIGVGATVAIGVGVGLWLLLRERTVRLADLDLVDMAPAFKTGFHPRTKPPQVIVIHHSATSNASATLAALRSKGYSTHFEVDQAGKIYRYLDPRTAVAIHAGSNWANNLGVGIDVTHATNAPWPPAQVAAVARLVNALCTDLGIPRGVAVDGKVFTGPGLLPAGVGVLRHRNVRVGGTLCPQDFPMAALGPVIAGDGPALV